MILENKTICLVGVSGAGMAPLAVYLAERGACVYGWDDSPDFNVKDLLISKHVIFLPEKILPENCDVVVISSAIHPDKDEICRYANKTNVRICKRGKFLAEILSDKKLIAIVGSHGKTSVCSNIAEIIINSKYHADYIIGGFFKDNKFPPANCFIDSEWVIAEVDESDCTIEHFIPEVTVALNYDDDHIVNYHGSEGLKAAFVRLFERTKKTIYIPTDESVFQNLSQNFSDKVIKLDNLPDKNFILRNQIVTSIVAKNELGISFEENFQFTGAKRRNDFLCKIGNITFIHDYAHHPTEVRAILNYTRSHYKNYNITVVFQPHRVSRTRQYYKEFAQALQNFDDIILVDIYRAFEEQLNGISSSMIYDEIANSHKLLVEDLKNLDATLTNYCKTLTQEKQHLILFVCAGDLVKYARAFVNGWRAKAISRELIGFEFEENADLKNKTTFGCSSRARIFVKPKDIDQLIFILKICQKYNSPYFVLGNGSNLVFPDEIFYKILIKLSGNFWNKIEFINDSVVRIFAGAKLSTIYKEISKKGFNCCSFLSCIPGTLGGAIHMNAGAYGYEISDVIEKIGVLDCNGNIYQLENKDCGFKYRESSIDDSLVILYADILLKNFDNLKNIQDLDFVRKDSQPIGRTFGSIFKNPTNNYAGKLIDQASLKGYRVGDVVVSEKHANFLLNLGAASATDVEKIIDFIRYKVFVKFGIFLENEVFLLRK